MIRILFFSLLLIVLAAAGLPACAQSLDEVAASSKADLQKALAELAEVQQRIGGEKIPLAQRLNEAEDAVLNQRKELDRAQRSAENQLVELNALKSELRARRDELGFLNSLLGEYVRLFETRTHISEVPRYQTVVADAKLAGTSADLTPAEKVGRQAAVVRASLDRLAGLLGGETFAGRALTPQGRFEAGTFTLVGPVAVFASGQGAAGIAELQLGSPEPTVIDVGAEYAAAIKTLVAGGAGELPVDATLGNALKIAAKKETILQHIMKGGPVMVPILLLGFVAVVICGIKWVQISRIRVASPQDLQLILNHLKHGHREKALARAAAIKGPVGGMLTSAIQHLDEKKEFIEEVMYEKMLETKPRLERLMPIIALTAATAPLLGLLGTVTGMINTFNMITIFGAGDPKTLSGGISEALITTEFGLIVAIPALLIHSFISRKAKGVLGSMEQTTVAFINGVPETTETNPEERPAYA